MLNVAALHVARKACQHAVAWFGSEAPGVASPRGRGSCFGADNVKRIMLFGRGTHSNGDARLCRRLRCNDQVTPQRRGAWGLRDEKTSPRAHMRAAGQDMFPEGTISGRSGSARGGKGQGRSRGAKGKGLGQGQHGAKRGGSAKGRGHRGRNRRDIQGVGKDIGCFPGDPANTALPWQDGEAAPPMPHVWNRSLEKFQTIPPKRCAIIVDRHVHKNGGSSVRDMLIENERQGYGLYQGYTQMYWQQDFRRLRKIAEKAISAGQVCRLSLRLASGGGGACCPAMQEQGRAARQRMATELPSLSPVGAEGNLHDGGPLWLGRVCLSSPTGPCPALAAVQARRHGQPPTRSTPASTSQRIRWLRAGVDCPLVAMTRVREPLEYYLSFYRWAVAFRQKQDPTSFGVDFIDWAKRVPDLQSTIMVQSMAAMAAEYHVNQWAHYRNSAMVGRTPDDQACRPGHLSVGETRGLKSAERSPQTKVRTSLHADALMPPLRNRHHLRPASPHRVRERRRQWCSRPPRCRRCSFPAPSSACSVGSGGSFRRSSTSLLSSALCAGSMSHCSWLQI